MVKRKRHTNNAEIKVVAYPQRVDAQNPWHVMWIVLVLLLLGIVALFILKAALYVIVIGGAVYIFYLLVHRKKRK